MPPNKLCHFKLNEDSGISSRKSDTSNGRDESSTCDRPDKESSCSDLSHSCNLSESNQSKGDLHSPIRGLSRGFKRPEYRRGMKRKKHFQGRADSMCDMDVNQSTGLTQEIDCIDIGSSTPKKRKSGNSPLKGVLKVKLV